MNISQALNNLDQRFELNIDQLSENDIECFSGDKNFPLILPKLTIASLGDPTFCTDYKVDFPYVGGAMANGIASVELVEALSKAGMLGFFGSAGLSIEKVRESVERLQVSLKSKPFGINFIHSPNEPHLEMQICELLLSKNICLVEASAFLDLTLPIVRYRLHGIHRAPDGTIICPNKVMAKVSRVEVATKFLSPAPEKMITELVNKGYLTTEQAQLAKQVPVAQDITAEADSGGHTDNRPAITLVPTIIALKDRLQKEFGYQKGIRVGAAGGISTPASAACAFAMGAAYIVTGTANQACVESGSCDEVRLMLAQAEQADTAMAPCADMFEMGVKVQVLKRGTMFPMRAQKLYDIYASYKSIEEIPEKDVKILEAQFFKKSLSETWAETAAFFQARDPRQIEIAEKNPKHKMALVFRSYLGQSSHWANRGEDGRRLDFQIWCGPAMGAFNEWVKGTDLEKAQNRRVANVARNILAGAAVLTRSHLLKAQGLMLKPHVLEFKPKPDQELEKYL